MTFPFTALSAAARQEGLIVAVLIGVAFGFVLERAGFGRADKLAAQFYLRDMRVFKVMFSAIVTAMLGLVIASGFGLVNLRDVSESIASFTWIWPMLAGGFVLGIGFIVSGYCPGTSVVSAGSGNFDGLVTVFGVITGTFVYSKLLLIPAFTQFHESAAKGPLFLYDLIKVRPQALAATFTVAAVLAFIGAEKVESMMGGTRTVRRTRRFAFATVGTLAAVALVTLAIPAAPADATFLGFLGSSGSSGAAGALTNRGTPRNRGTRGTEVPSISAAELAHVVVDAPWSVRIVDVRDRAAFVKERIPGSQNVPAASLPDLPDDGRPLIVVGAANRLPPNARVLAGGLAAWNGDPLVKAMTTGAPPPPPPAATGGPIAKPAKKGGGCSA